MIEAGDARPAFALPARAVAVLCALAGLLVLVVPSALASLGSSGREAAPCLRRKHLPPFTAYDLGPSFEGLARSSEVRDCYAPPFHRHIRIDGPYAASVAWTSFVDYGTCTPEGGEGGGCTDPLEIQSWPECDRSFYIAAGAKSPKDLPAQTSYRLSGSRKIPTVARLYGITTWIEMYTGQTTIVIFSGGPDLAVSAAHALARIVAPKLSSRSAASLRAAAVSTRGCGGG
jgi:hypothetical protein